MSHLVPRSAFAWRGLAGVSLSLSLAASMLSAGPVAANGELDWAFQFGAPETSEASGVATTDDAVYVAGTSFPSYVRKYLHDGDVVWERTLPGGAQIKDVDADTSGIYLSGVTDVALPGQPSPHGVESFLVKYSPAGSLIWARQFNLPALGAVRAGNGYSFVQLTAAGVFVAGEGDSTSFVRLFDRDGDTIWTRYVLGRLQALSADGAGALTISANTDWSSPTLRSFDNAGVLRATRPVPGVFLHTLAPAIGGGYYLGYRTFTAPGGPSLGYVARYSAPGSLVWARRYGGPQFGNPGGMAQFRTRLYISWTETDAEAMPRGRWAAVSPTNGDVIWRHDVEVEPETSVFPLSLAVGPQGGYLAGGVEGALAGEPSSGGLRESFLMKFTIDTAPPSILFTGYALPPRVPLTIDDFTGMGSWTLSDTISGVALVELQESSDDATWNDVLLPEPKATSALIDVKPNDSHQFRVRATDRSGNKSAWSMSKLFQTDLLQEDASGTTYDAKWHPAPMTGASGGAVMTTSTAGAVAKLQFTGDAIGLVTTVGPTRGRVEVYLDGVKMKTLDLYAPSVTKRMLAFVRDFGGVTVHNLKLVAEGTAGRARIDIDAYEVRSTSP